MTYTCANAEDPRVETDPQKRIRHSEDKDNKTSRGRQPIKIKKTIKKKIKKKHKKQINKQINKSVTISAQNFLLIFEERKKNQ